MAIHTLEWDVDSKRHRRVYPGGAMIGGYQRPHTPSSVFVGVSPPGLWPGGETPTKTENNAESPLVAANHRPADTRSAVAFTV